MTNPDEVTLVEKVKAAIAPELVKWGPDYVERVAKLAIAAIPLVKMREALEEERRDAIIAAYIAGALAVHKNWQEDRDPDFTEAAHDYASDAALSSNLEGG